MFLPKPNNNITFISWTQHKSGSKKHRQHVPDDGRAGRGGTLPSAYK